MPERLKARRLVEHYFVGDPIGGLLFLASECSTVPMVREDISSIADCLYIEVYELEVSKGVFFPPRTQKPIDSASLSFLKIDDNNSWNIKNKDKKEFYRDEGHSEGLETESFEIRNLFGRDLPAGKYMFKLVAKQKECSFYTSLSAGRRLVIIHEPDTPRLRAHKLCREAGRMIKGKWKDAATRKRVIEDKIMPALEICPESPCAHRHISYYFWLNRNREKFIEHYKASCEAQVFKAFRDACFFSFRCKLDRWDKPDSWLVWPLKRQENKASVPKKDTGGISNEIIELCRKGTKILSQRKGYYDRDAWEKAVREFFLPALELDPKAPCALDNLTSYYLEIAKDREKFIEYSRRRCEAASSDNLRQICPVDYHGSCQDATEDKLRDLCHQLTDKVLKMQNWSNKR